MDKYIFRKRKALDLQTSQHIINTFLEGDQEWNNRGYYAIYPSLSDKSFLFLKSNLRKYMDEYVEKHKFLNFYQGIHTLESHLPNSHFLQFGRVHFYQHTTQVQL